MLEVTKLEAFNLEGAIRGMRQPFKNTDKSDSGLTCPHGEYNMGIEFCSSCVKPNCSDIPYFIIGHNDLRIAQGLIKAGSPHDKFMRQIFVSMDINAPLYWWKEMNTYKIGTVANSESTMHTITKSKFSIDNFSYDNSFYNDNTLTTVGGMSLLHQDIFVLNTLCDYHNKEEDPDRKNRLWRTIIQRLPCSYMQKRTWSANYSILHAIVHQRGSHKLTEWSRDLIQNFHDLPYAEELIFYKGE